MDWKHWLKGLVGGAIGGAATAVTMTIVDPATFNFAEGWGKLWHLVVISAVVNAAMFLKQSPLPTDSTPPQQTQK